MYKDLSYEELVIRAGEDKGAVSEIIARYMCTIEAMAKKLSAKVSDDLVQEGLMALMNAVKTYDAGKGVAFASYAGVCVKNKMISSLKKNSLSDTDYITDDSLEEILQADSDDIPDNVVIERERMNELNSKISSALSELEWQVFQMFLSGMSYNQIALNSGLTVKAVNNAMQRVRRKLKALLR